MPVAPSGLGNRSSEHSGHNSFCHSRSSSSDAQPILHACAVGKVTGSASNSLAENKRLPSHPIDRQARRSPVRGTRLLQPVANQSQEPWEHIVPNLNADRPEVRSRELAAARLAPFSLSKVRVRRATLPDHSYSEVSSLNFV